MKLTQETQVELFKSLASTHLYEAGVNYNFDRFYKNKTSVKNAVYKIYNNIKNNPQDYGVTMETAELVAKAVSGRSAAPGARQVIDVSKLDTKEVLATLQGKSMNLLNKKLDAIGKSRKKLDAVSLSQLGTITGILFDKNQIIKGEATQNIAVHAKIEKDMSPEALMELVQKERESNFVQNTQK